MYLDPSLFSFLRPFLKKVIIYYPKPFHTKTSLQEIFLMHPSTARLEQNLMSPLGLLHSKARVVEILKKPNRL
jgi:hypothetical protein